MVLGCATAVRPDIVAMKQLSWHPPSYATNIEI
jgi:hypothetical protein